MGSGDTGISVVLFDLDGTLIDTVDEIADAINDAVAPLKPGKRIERALVQSWVGNGAAMSFKRALRHCGVEESVLQREFDARWDCFYEAYAHHCGTNSQPYAGVMACLQALQQANYRMGVVTNKEDAFTHKAIAAQDMQRYFDVVIAGNTLPVNKPDPQMLLTAFDRLGEDHRQGLFVGDSIVDLQTGAAAGVRTWAVTYGYHHGEFDRPLPAATQPERFVDGFDEIRQLLV